MKNKIVLKQSCIEINNYILGDSIKLENTFSVYDKIYFTRVFKSIDYIEKENKLILPRGIDIYWLENIFMETAVIDHNCDKFVSSNPIMIKSLPRDNDQKEALRFMLGEGEYKYNKGKSQLSVNLNTGAGKTYVSIATIAYSCIKSIIITGSIDWLNQWKNKTIEYTDINPSEIYFISGSSSISRLLTRDVSKYKLFLVSHGTLKSYGDTNGWNAISQLFIYLGIGLKFYDEAHLNFDNMCKIDFYTNTYKTYYVTATPARSNEDENIIFGYYFKNIPSIDLFDEDEDPRTKYMSFRYNSHPTPQEISDCKNQYGLDRNKYTNYIINKENFHYILHIIIDRIKRTQGKFLIYIGTNNAILFVYEWIKENYPELMHQVGIFTSITTENKQQQLEKKIILSTTKSCGAAVDIPDLKVTIPLAEPFKSEVLARQTLGRTRNRDTLYLDIVDDGFYYTKKYYQYKQPIFEKYATECIEVKINDEELKNKADKFYNKRNSMIHPVRFNEYDYLIKPIAFNKE